jgi:hypothetical protein
VGHCLSLMEAADLMRRHRSCAEVRGRKSQLLRETAGRVDAKVKGRVLVHGVARGTHLIQVTSAANLTTLPRSKST